MRRLADHVVVVLAGHIAHVSEVVELDASAPPAVREFLAEWETAEPDDE
jgi:hypothetical protein